MMCPALKMAIRTHMQLKRSVSKVRQRDHQVQRNRKMKKYTAEVSEGSMIPAGTNSGHAGLFGRWTQARSVEMKQTPPSCLDVVESMNLSFSCNTITQQTVKVVLQDGSC